MSKTAVMLKGGWPGNFRRVVRDDEGNPVKDDSGAEQILEFSPGQTVELDAKQLEAVRDDIGKSLVLVKQDKGQPVSKADNESTRKFVEDTRQRREKEAALAKADKQRAAATAPAAPETPRRPAAKADLEHKGK